ncbi:hypothetical protein [Pseudochrobactrum saccharolyticum]|uniref:hypothetical protein n=1 Tax=Pseudochrobactrum saccharolyticum TaxID=354352 RepID=UPI002761B618|nr:hypothetical protein [Pseudochrobactrum saccharolyticum]MDP8252471.1 hypothetical protein [Pseudochrobactrum saccharolyticum]
MLEAPEKLRAQMRMQRLMQMQDMSLIRPILQKAGLRPTRQRLILGQFQLSLKKI